MRTGTLPLTVENLNTSATGSSSQLRSVCLAIYAEGDFSDYTFWRAADLEVETTVTQNLSHQTIMAIRSKAMIGSIRNSVISYPEKLNVFANHPVELTFWQGVEVVSGNWNMQTESSIEGSSDAILGFSNAYKFTVIYLEPGAHNICLRGLFEINYEGIQLNADNSYNNWAITAKRLDGNNASVKVNLCYRELW